MTIIDQGADQNAIEKPDPLNEDLATHWNRVVGRRSFLRNVGAAGAVVAVPGSVLWSAAAAATAADVITKGDVAILRFLAAAEILESDLWQQYNELGGVAGGNTAYMAALSNLDADMPQYITDNTDDEISHANFLNAYLMSKGADPVNLDEFRNLPSSKATGAAQIGRLTNLMDLDVDTSFYLRYRGTGNPDLGASFGQAINIQDQPAIPLNDKETPPKEPQPVPPTTQAARRMQAIANTAAFHFAMIEQGGSSLYATMALKASSLEVLRIIVSIGGVEVDHFGLWHDKLGNCVSGMLAGVTDPITNLTFPDFNAPPRGGEAFQTNLILPEPCGFIRSDLPACSVIRPSSTALSGAEAAVAGLTKDDLFEGQSNEFFRTVANLAEEADDARRQLS